MTRSHFLARLNAGLEGRLTLVSAPAGFGKATLIVQWGRQLAEKDQWRIVRLSLDENDNDLGRFFSYFIAALQNVDGTLAPSHTSAPEYADYAAGRDVVM